MKRIFRILAMLIAQISDLHVMRPGRFAPEGLDTAASLSRCVEHILQFLPLPDAVLATGDLVDEGTAEEYARLRELLAPLGMPVYLIPGNHDDRAALRAEFRDHVYLRPLGRALRYVVDDYDVRLIALDTLVDGEDGGALEAEQAAWLDAKLGGAPRRPTLIFMHHPPFATGMRYLDAMALDHASTGRFGEIVERHDQIERIVCGHVHRGIQARWRGTIVSVCPSTAFQACLDLRGSGFNASLAEPPAYQMHYWNGSELVTHTVCVGASERLFRSPGQNA